jgi:hypothetical protein
LPLCTIIIIYKFNIIKNKIIKEKIKNIYVLKNDCLNGNPFNAVLIEGIITSVTYVPSLCSLIESGSNAGFAQIFDLK